MNYTEQLKNCNTVAIYLGNTCNFNCTYCDREYISDKIGGQNFSNHQLKLIHNFFTQIYKDSTLSVDRVALHGGEPFLFVKRMDQILDNIKPFLDKHNLYVSITTNASLLEESKWFLEKWAKYLKLTFSYDFIFQKENRESVDINKVIDICNELNIGIHWQFVMPITDRRAFSLDLVKDIVHTVSRCKVQKTINLIPLRHERGRDKFKVYIDDLDLYQFADALTKFINTLYNYNLMVYVDGSYGSVDKNYLGEHYKMILSPDGYIYPEYDFCEYKTEEYRIGRWTDGLSTNFEPVIHRYGEDFEFKQKCLTCPSKKSCGLKYLYQLFDEQPGNKCSTYYKIIDLMVEYVTKLNSKNGFIEWVTNGNQ